MDFTIQKELTNRGCVGMALLKYLLVTFRTHTLFIDEVARVLIQKHSTCAAASQHMTVSPAAIRGLLKYILDELDGTTGAPFMAPPEPQLAATFLDLATNIDLRNPKYWLLQTISNAGWLVGTIVSFEQNGHTVNVRAVASPSWSESDQQRLVSIFLLFTTSLVRFCFGNEAILIGSGPRRHVTSNRIYWETLFSLETSKLYIAPIEYGSL